MLHGVLSRAFVHGGGVLAPLLAPLAAIAANHNGDIDQTRDMDMAALVETQFSYHAFLGGNTCQPANWEKTWGVSIGIILVIYICLILTRVCDQYLIPSLEVLSMKWGLSEDVAGVTLLAFGGSFPELAIHTIATGQQHTPTRMPAR